MDQINIDTQLMTPWAIDVSRIRTLFKGDPEIQIVDDIDSRAESEAVSDYNCEIIVHDNPIKAMGLDRIMKKTFNYGNVNLNVTVKDDSQEDVTNLKFYEAAFQGNPNFVKTVIAVDTFGQKWPFVVMDKVVAQFPAGSTNDLYGNENQVMARLTKDLTNFEDLGILICTYDPDSEKRIAESNTVIVDQ